MIFYLKLIAGTFAFLCSVALLYLRKYLFAIPCFDFAYCLLAGSFYDKICDMRKRQRDRFLQLSQGKAGKTDFHIKPLLFVWAWPVVFMTSVGVSMYFHSVFWMLVFSGLYIISAGIAQLQHTETAYRKHFEVYENYIGRARDDSSGRT